MRCPFSAHGRATLVPAAASDFEPVPGRKHRRPPLVKPPGWPFRTLLLDCVQSGFPGADPDRFLDGGDKYLAVADPPGLGGATDRVDGSFHHVVAKYDLDFDLGEEIHHVLGAAIEFRMSFLATEALGFRHRDALQTDLL